MAQDLNAGGRITINYTVLGRPHKVHAFCNGITPSGGTFTVQPRLGDPGPLDWVECADQFHNAVSNCLSNSTVTGIAELHQNIGGVFVPVATTDLVPIVYVGGLSVASQVTLTLRATDLTRLKIVMLDTKQSPPQKIVSPVSGDTNMDTFITYFLSTAGNLADPWHWAVTKGGAYLAASSFIKASVWLNNKVGRAAGV